MAFSIMNARQKQKFKDNFEIDIAYSVPGPRPLPLQHLPAARHGGPGPARHPGQDPDHPRADAARRCSRGSAEEQRGLILCTGTTGSGKSTTLAAMIDYINAQRTEHIITIEDPIEFLHRDKKSIVNQREVDVDTQSLRRARCAPRCARTPTSSWSARCATTRRSRPRSPPPRPATSCSRRCTPWTPPRPSTASSRSSRRTSRSRSACSSRRVLKAVISHAPGAARRRPRPRARGRGDDRRPPYIRDCIENKDKTKLIHEAIAAGTVAVRHADLRPVALPALQERR